MCVKDVAEQQCFLLSSVLQGPAPIMSAGPVVCRDLDIDSAPSLQAGLMFQWQRAESLQVKSA